MLGWRFKLLVGCCFIGLVSGWYLLAWRPCRAGSSLRGHVSRELSSKDLLATVATQRQQGKLLLHDKGSLSLQAALAAAQAKIASLEAASAHQKAASRLPPTQRATKPQPRQSGKKTKHESYLHVVDAHTPWDNRLGVQVTSTQSSSIYETFYPAFVRSQQSVVAGKVISFVLREAIPYHNLSKGTIVRGVPQRKGPRIMLEITSCITNNTPYSAGRI